MSAAIERVAAAELKAKWFSADAAGMTHDYQRDLIVVRMTDGSQFACSFAEHSALRAGETS